MSQVSSFIVQISDFLTGCFIDSSNFYRSGSKKWETVNWTFDIIFHSTSLSSNFASYEDDMRADYRRQSFPEKRIKPGFRWILFLFQLFTPTPVLSIFAHPESNPNRCWLHFQIKLVGFLVHLEGVLQFKSRPLLFVWTRCLYCQCHSVSVFISSILSTTEGTESRKGRIRCTPVVLVTKLHSAGC